MPAGSFAGALLVSYVADWIGRKNTVILSGLVWVIGSLLQCTAVVCVLHFSSHTHPKTSYRTVGCLSLVELSPASPSVSRRLVSHFISQKSLHPQSVVALSRSSNGPSPGVFSSNISYSSVALISMASRLSGFHGVSR